MTLSRLLLAFSLVIFAVAPVGCSDDKSDIAVLECTGECSCDAETRSCTCSGGTTCAIEGAEDITFHCAGNAACDLTCGVGCHVICPGTTGCTVSLGDRSSAECQGTAMCEYSCEGECDVACSGAASCTVLCAEGCALEGTNCRC